MRVERVLRTEVFYRIEVLVKLQKNKFSKYVGLTRYHIASTDFLNIKRIIFLFK